MATVDQDPLSIPQETVIDDSALDAAISSYVKSPLYLDAQRKAKRTALRDEMRSIQQGTDETLEAKPAGPAYSRMRAGAYGVEIPEPEVSKPEVATLLGSQAGVAALGKQAGRGVEVVGRVIRGVGERLLPSDPGESTVQEALKSTGSAIQKVGDVAATTYRNIQRDREKAIEDMSPGLVSRLGAGTAQALEVTAPTLAVPGSVAKSTFSLLRAANAARVAANPMRAAALISDLEKAAGNIALGSAALFGGAQSGLDTYDSAREQLEQVYAPEQAEKLARVPAALSAASTTFWTLVFGKGAHGGIERTAALGVPKSMLAKAFKDTVGQLASKIGSHGLGEAGEEMADQATQALIEKLTYETNKTPEQIAQEVLFAGGLGFVLGGSVGAASDLMGGKQEAKRAQDVQQLIESGQPVSQMTIFGIEEPMSLKRLQSRIERLGTALRPWIEADRDIQERAARGEITPEQAEQSRQVATQKVMDFHQTVRDLSPLVEQAREISRISREAAAGRLPAQAVEDAKENMAVDATFNGYVAQDTDPAVLRSAIDQLVESVGTPKQAQLTPIEKVAEEADRKDRIAGRMAEGTNGRDLIRIANDVSARLVGVQSPTQQQGDQLSAITGLVESLKVDPRLKSRNSQTKLEQLAGLLNLRFDPAAKDVPRRFAVEKPPQAPQQQIDPANQNDVVAIAQDFVDRMSSIQQPSPAQKAEFNYVYNLLNELRFEEDPTSEMAKNRLGMIAEFFDLRLDPGAQRMPNRFSHISGIPWEVMHARLQDAQPPGAQWEMTGGEPTVRTMKEEEGSGELTFEELQAQAKASPRAVLAASTAVSGPAIKPAKAPKKGGVQSEGQEKGQEGLQVAAPAAAPGAAQAVPAPAPLSQPSQAAAAPAAPAAAPAPSQILRGPNGGMLVYNPSLPQIGTFEVVDDSDPRFVTLRQQNGILIQALKSNVKPVEPPQPTQDQVVDAQAEEDAEIAAAEAAFAAELGKVKTSAFGPLDPKLNALAIKLGYLMARKGLRRFSQFAKRMVRKFGDSVIPHLRSWYVSVRESAGAPKDQMDVDSVIDAAIQAKIWIEPEQPKDDTTKAVESLNQKINGISDEKDLKLIADSKRPIDITLDRFLGMPIQDLDAFKDKVGMDLTAVATNVGRRFIRTETDMWHAMRRYRLEMLKWRRAMATEKLELAGYIGIKGQLIREAIEFATGEGSMMAVVLKDPTFRPAPLQRIDFSAVFKESDDEMRDRINHPAPGSEPKPQPKQVTPLEGYPVVRTMRTGFLKQLATAFPKEAVARAEKENATAAELAYLRSLITQLGDRESRFITNAMHNEARHEAMRYGFVTDEPDLPVKYPKLYGAPKDSPVGDRLYRTTRILANGVRTVAIEFTHKLNAEITENSEYGGPPPTFPISAAEAAIRDHIIITRYGRFAGFRGFGDEVKTVPLYIRGLYERISAAPSPEYLEAKLYEDSRSRKRRFKWVGLRPVTEVKTVPTVEEAYPTQLTAQQLEDGVNALNELEGTDAAQMLFRNFQWDVEYRGYQVSAKDPNDVDETGARKAEAIRQQPRLTTNLLNLYHEALFEPPYQDKKSKQRFVDVSIPGLIKPIAIPVTESMDQRAIYASFIGAVVDIMTSMAVSVHVRVAMGIPTALMVVSKGQPKEDVTQFFVRGAKVLVKDGDQQKHGVIMSVNEVPVFRRRGVEMTPGVVTDMIVGVRGSMPLYSVALDEMDPKTGKPRILANRTAEDIDPEPVTAADGTNLLKRKVKVHKTYRGQADPTIFEGEPFGNNELLGMSLRLWYRYGNGSKNSVDYLRSHIRNFSKQDLLDTLRRLGVKDAPTELFQPGMESDLAVERQRRAHEAYATGQKVMWLTPAFTQSWEAYPKHKQAMMQGRLAQMLIDRVVSLYSVIVMVGNANSRMKEFASRELLRAVPTKDDPKTLAPLVRVEQEIRKAQAHPPSQNSRITKDIEEKWLPERDPNMVMAYRLINQGTFEVHKSGLDEKTIDSLIRMPLGPILLRVSQVGTKPEGEPTDPLKTEETTAKEINSKPETAWLSVDRSGKAMIQVKDGEKWRTIYWVDLGHLQALNAAQPFTLDVDDKKGVSGWYITPSAVMNSAKDESGNSLWNALAPEKESRIPEKKDFLSIDDLKIYIRDSLSHLDPSMITHYAWEERGGVGREPTVGIESDAFKTHPGTKGLLDLLETKGTQGQMIAAEIESADIPITDDAAWEDLTSRVADVLTPGWESTLTEDQKHEKLGPLYQAVQLAREAAARRKGFMGAIGEGLPMLSEVDAAIVGKQAKGKAQIIELISAPRNGLSEEAKRQSLAFIEKLPEQMLADLTFQITPTTKIGNDRRIRYVGSFSHALRLARIVANNPNASAVVEEISHSLARFIPEGMRGALESQRLGAVRDMAIDPKSSTAAREFAQMLYSHGGAITSEAFLGMNRQDWAPFYALINTDEYFAHNLTAAGRRANQDPETAGIVRRMLNWLKDFMASVKAFLGDVGIQRDKFFDKILSDINDGKFTTTANAGFLHEVNALSDLGAIAIALRKPEVIALANSPGFRSREEIGRQIMAANYTPSVILNRAAAGLTLAGEEVSSHALSLIDVKNREETVEATMLMFETPPVDVQIYMSNTTDEFLRNEVAVGLVGGFQDFERKLHRSRTIRQKWQDKIEGQEFAQMVRNAAKSRQGFYTQETLAESLDAQIQMAMRGAEARARAQGASQAAIEAALNEQKYWSTVRGYRYGIAQKISQITQALSQSQEGMALLSTDTPGDAMQIRDAYLATNPPPEQTQVEPPVLDTAYMILARNVRLRKRMMAQTFLADENVLGAMSGLAARLAAEVNKPRNANAVRRMLRLERGVYSDLEKAKRVMIEQESKIKAWLHRFEAADQAVRIGEAAIADPEYVALREQYSAYVGEKRVPKAYDHIGMPRIGKSITLPMPISNTPLEINFTSDNDEWSLEQGKALACVSELEEWLHDPANMNSVDAGYFRWWKEWLDGVMMSAQFNDFGKINFRLKIFAAIADKSFGNLTGILRQHTNRFTQTLAAPLAAFNSASLLMERWAQVHGRVLTQNLMKAAESHKDILDLREMTLAVGQWYNLIGRELFAIAGSGWDPVVGRELPGSGIAITEADVAALRQQVAAFDAAYAIDVVHGRELWIPSRTVDDQFVQGVRYSRKSMKLGTYQMPRVFNPEAIGFTKDYAKAMAFNLEESQRQSAANPAAARSLLRAQFLQAVRSFLLDFDYAGAPTGQRAEMYRAALAEINAGNITTLDQFETYLDGAGLDEVFTGSAQFYQDFDALQANLYRKLIEPRVSAQSSEKALKTVLLEQLNSFTVGTQRRIAPFWWYNFGLSNDLQVRSFILNGASFYFNGFDKALSDAISMLDDYRDTLNNRRREMMLAEGLSEPESESRMKSEQRRRVERGQDSLYYDEVDSLIKGLQTAQRELQETYVPGQRFIDNELAFANRLFGQSMGNLLKSVSVGTINWVQTILYAAQRTHRITDNLIYAYGKAGYEFVKQVTVAALYTPYAAIANLPKIHGVRTAVEIGKMLKSPFRPEPGERRAQGFFRHLNRAAIELVLDYSTSMVDDLFKLSRFYDEMDRRGLNLPRNPRPMLETMATQLHTYGLINPLEASLTPSGRQMMDMIRKGDLSSMSDTALRLMSKLGKSAAGMVDLQMGLFLGHILPRAGDLAGSQAAFAITQGGLLRLQHHLLKKFVQLRDGGVARPRVDRLTPAFLFPGWFTESKNYESMEHLVFMFGAAGMDLKSAINSYFDRLSVVQDPAQLKAVEFLNTEQMANIAQQAVEDLNQAVPGNRPLLARKNIATRIFFALNGWRLNMFSLQMHMLGTSARKVDVDGNTIRSRAILGNWWFIMVSLLFAGAAGKALWEEMVRQLMRYAMGTERSSRQIWERESAREVGKQILADASTIIPYVDIAMNFAFNDQPSRRSMTPTLPIQNQIISLMNYGAGVANTGDVTFGLDSLMKSIVPMSGAILNRLPAYKGRLEAMNTQRLLAKYGDTDLMRQGGQSGFQMTGALATTLTPYANRMVNAAMLEDYDELENLYEEAVGVAMQERGYDRKKAEDLVQQMYTSRNPYSRVYKAQLTGEQRRAVIDRMNQREKGIVLSTEELLRRGAHRIGAEMRFSKDDVPRQATYSRGLSRTARLLHIRTGRSRVLRGRLGRRLTRRLGRA